jgi:hypothetical protein
LPPSHLQQGLSRCVRLSVNTWTTVVDHAKTIYSGYADPPKSNAFQTSTSAMPTRRPPVWARNPVAALPHVEKGDIILENCIPFMRDELHGCGKGRGF